VQNVTKQYRYLSLVMLMFVVAILLSNITAAKLVQIGPVIVAGGTLFFPLTYIFGDTLTEVYGYSSTRKAIWLGMGAMLFFTIGTWIVQVAPAPAFWKNQEAYDKILGILWRINLAGLIAYLCGEFFNSYVLAKLKVKTAEKVNTEAVVNQGMASRFILSTVIGQFVDSAIFITCAFAGTVPSKALVIMFLSSWGIKVCWEVIALPFTIPVVKWIKRMEEADALDRNTDFNPLHFK
jgi:uncharacterized integral membrane protein (TIGR00697 family)